MASVHLASFAESALSRLGEEAVRRYYEWQFVGPHDSHAWGAFQEGRLVGFCLAGVFRGATGGFLAHNQGFLMWRILSHPWLLLNPLVREKVRAGWGCLRRFAWKGASVEAKPGVAQGSSVSLRSAAAPFGILTICVDPCFQRGGVGRSLMKQAEEAARALHFREMLLTVRPENRKAIEFYRGLGWEMEESDQAKTVAMRKKICSVPS